MTRQSVSISVSVDDNEFIISREVDIDWPGYPTMETVELLDDLYQQARNGIMNVTPKAPF